MGQVLPSAFRPATPPRLALPETITKVTGLMSAGSRYRSFFISAGAMGYRRFVAPKESLRLKG